MSVNEKAKQALVDLVIALKNEKEKLTNSFGEVSAPPAFSNNLEIAIGRAKGVLRDEGYVI